MNSTIRSPGRRSGDESGAFFSSTAIYSPNSSEDAGGREKGQVAKPNQFMNHTCERQQLSVGTLPSVALGLIFPSSWKAANRNSSLLSQVGDTSSNPVGDVLAH